MSLTTQRIPIIAVVGGNSITELVKPAYAVGRAIAKAGALLLTGGQPTSDPHVKCASMQGALDEGRDKGVPARLLGILPEGEFGPANIPAEQRFVETRLKSAERNVITAMTCDAMIVFEGGGGTLSELGFGLAAQKPILFAGSIAGLKKILAEHDPTKRDEWGRMQSNLDKGSKKFRAILGQLENWQQIEGLVVALLEKSTDSAAPPVDHIHGDYAAWAGPLVEKAIKEAKSAIRSQRSGFPDIQTLPKVEFENWLSRMH